ncbi:MAG: glycosyltransferase 87 family protein [Candidatus Dormibacteria bacterium]
MTRHTLRVATALAIATAVLLVYAARWVQMDAPRIDAGDFTATYVGGSLWRDGHRADLYSEPLQYDRHAHIDSPRLTSDLLFANPPVAAVLAAPFTLLGLSDAYRLWTLLQVALLVAAVVSVARAAPWPDRWGAVSRYTAGAAALAGVAGLPFLLLGQWDGIVALGVALAYVAWRRGGRFGGGALLALSIAIAKPHLGLGLAAFLLGWRDRRALAGALAGVLIAVVASVLAAGVAGMAGFAQGALADAGRWPLRSLIGFTGLAGSWLGDGRSAHALAAVATVMAMAVCVYLGAMHRRRPVLLEVTLGAAVVLSLVASPHLRMHDLVMLAPVLVWVVAWAARQDALPRPQSRIRQGAWLGGGGGRCVAVVVGLWLAVNTAAALDLGNSQPAPPGRVVPLALVAAGALAVMVVRSSTVVV